MRRFCLPTIAAACVSGVLATPAFGQNAGQAQGAYAGPEAPPDRNIPNPGDVIDLYPDTNPAGVNFQNAFAFHVNDISLTMNHLSTAALQETSAVLAGTTSRNPFFANNMAGVDVWAGYGNIRVGNQPLAPGAGFVVALPCASSGFQIDPAMGNLLVTIPASGPLTNWSVILPFDDLYGVRFDAPTYEQGLQAYQAWYNGGASTATFTGTRNFTPSQLRGALFACSVRTSPQNQIAGNPNSLQSQMVTAGLDFSGNSLSDTAPTTTTSGQPSMGQTEAQWGVGAQAGRIEQFGQAGVQLEMRLNRSFRVLRGNRSLLAIDLPVTYQRVGGVNQWRGFLGVSLLVPMSRQWTIEPRVAYGYSTMPALRLNGQLASLSLASRVFFDNLIGRGQVSLGGQVGYSRTFNLRYDGRAVSGKVENWTARAAAAYELPFKSRIGGRQVSLRTSYAYTRFFGDRLYAQQMHDATVSVGVRLREESVRNRVDTLRVGISGSVAHGYNRIAGFVGVRF